MKQYYKILHEDMKHYDMQYHLGLNEDVKPFSPEPKCDEGLFFADKENVLDYLSYGDGNKLAIIEIPKGERIIQVRNNYKAHRIIIKEIKDLWTKENYKWLKETCDDTKIFINACRYNNLNFAKWIQKKGTVYIHADNECAFRWACKNGHLEMAKWLHKLGNIDIHAKREYAFRWACKNGYLEMAKWLHGLGTDIHVLNDFAFQKACGNGHLEVAKWLYSLGNVNIHADREHAFRWACANGHLAMAKWLQELGVDIHANEEYAFRWACRNGHLEIVKWLYNLEGVDIQSYRDELLAYSPDSVKKWLNTLKKPTNYYNAMVLLITDETAEQELNKILYKIPKPSKRLTNGKDVVRIWEQLSLNKESEFYNAVHSIIMKNECAIELIVVSHDHVEERIFSDDAYHLYDNIQPVLKFFIPSSFKEYNNNSNQGTNDFADMMLQSLPNEVINLAYEKRNLEYHMEDARQRLNDLGYAYDEETVINLAQLFDSTYDGDVADNDRWNIIIKNYYEESNN